MWKNYASVSLGSSFIRQKTHKKAQMVKLCLQYTKPVFSTHFNKVTSKIFKPNLDNEFRLVFLLVFFSVYRLRIESWVVRNIRVHQGIDYTSRKKTVLRFKSLKLIVPEERGAGNSVCNRGFTFSTGNSFWAISK